MDVSRASTSHATLPPPMCESLQRVERQQHKNDTQLEVQPQQLRRFEPRSIHHASSTRRIAALRRGNLFESDELSQGFTRALAESRH